MTFSREDFVALDWNAPLEMNARLAAVPKDVTIKGMFLLRALRQAKQRGGFSVKKRYTAFSDYPASEVLEVFLDCARHAFPNVTEREGLRRLGISAYPTFAETVPGKVLLAMTNLSWTSVLDFAPRAYATVGGARVSVEWQGERCAVVKLRDLWSFPDAYHIGVFEGAMREFETGGTTRIHVRSFCDVDLLLEWTV